MHIFSLYSKISRSYELPGQDLIATTSCFGLLQHQPVEKAPKLTVGQRDRAIVLGCCRRLEPAVLQPFVIQLKAVSIPIQDFDFIPTLSQKTKYTS